MTKHRKNRLHRDTLAATLKQHFPLNATRLTVLCAIVLGMIQARSVVLYTSLSQLELPGEAHVRHKRLKAFSANIASPPLSWTKRHLPGLSA